MSIENNLYNWFYDGFERRKNRVKELRTENNTDKLDKLEKDLKGTNKKIGYVQAFCWAGAGLGFYNLATELNNPHTSEMASQTGLFLGIMGLSLGTHFRQAKKLENLLTDKILGKDTEVNPKDVRKWERIGRYSHLTGVSTLLTILGKASIDFFMEYPLVTGILGGLGAFCYYHNFVEGYSALYSSMSDFILGERRPKK